MSYLIVYGVPVVAMLVGWLAWSRLEVWLDGATETERGGSLPKTRRGVTVADRTPRSVSAAPYDWAKEDAA